MLPGAFPSYIKATCAMPIFIKHAPYKDGVMKKTVSLPWLD